MKLWWCKVTDMAFQYYIPFISILYYIFDFNWVALGKAGAGLYISFPDNTLW